VRERAAAGSMAAKTEAAAAARAAAVAGRDVSAPMEVGMRRKREAFM